MLLGTIGINGTIGSGKDFLTECITRRAAESGVRVELIKFRHGVETVAEFILKLAGLPIPDWEHKTPEQRAFLQHLGTDACRAYFPDIWVYIFRNTIQRCIEVNADDFIVVVSDVRFENEVEILEREFNADVCRVTCNEEVRRKRLLARDGYIDEEKMAHSSEHGLDGYPLLTFDNSYDDDESMSEAANYLIREISAKMVDYQLSEVA